MGSALEAKFAITEVLYRYCRAVDRMDRPLAETVWHADGTADYGLTYRGSAAGLLDNLWANHAKLLGHSHQVTNILIDVDVVGDRAASESYAMCMLWNVAESGVLVQLTALGRYLDRWSRRDGGWAIDHRRFVYDNVFVAAPSIPPEAHGELLARTAARRDPTQTAARRDRSDPSYELFPGVPFGL